MPADFRTELRNTLAAFTSTPLREASFNFFRTLGQLKLYVNYYDREKRTAGDQPTLGLILCTDKNDAVVKYTLGADQEKTIFASRYKLHLPSEAELKAEVRRELKQLSSPTKS